MISIIDNFYDANTIKEVFEDYCSYKHVCPGLRSVPLRELDPNYYDSFRETIFNLHNIPLNSNANFWTYLTKHEYDSNEPECLNFAWPHVDGNTNFKELNYLTYDSKMLFGGFIYLDEFPDPDCGISFHTPKDTMSRKELYDIVLHGYLKDKEAYESGEITVDELNHRYKLYYDKFNLDVQIKNKFNRLVTWKCGIIRSSRRVSKQQKTKLIHSFYITYD